MRLTYHVAGRDKAEERDVDPMRLLVVESHTYLEAWYPRAEGIRLFRMDRVLGLAVLPVADLGIRKGFQRLFGLRKLPEGPRMEKLARPFRPYRSIACWYLWRLTEEKAEAT